MGPARPTTQGSRIIPIHLLVEANHRVGMGHLMEACDLADVLKRRKGVQITFLLYGDTKAKAILEARGFAYRVVGNPHRLPARRVSAMLEVLPGQKAPLVVDLYKASPALLAGLKERARPLIVILDHAKHPPLPGDLVVNFSIVPQTNGETVPGTSGTRYMRGPRYMPLSRGAHAIWKTKKPIRGRCRYLLVTEGGSDPHNLTRKIVQDLELGPLPMTIVVILGPFMKPHDREAILKQRPALANTYLFRNSATRQEMHKWMRQADIAVTTAGNTLYELALFHVPCITVNHHPRHEGVAEAFAKRKAVINLGIGTRIKQGEIYSAVSELAHSPRKREELSRNIRHITDGLGAERVASEMLKRI